MNTSPKIFLSNTFLALEKFILNKNQSQS